MVIVVNYIEMMFLSELNDNCMGHQPFIELELTKNLKTFLPIVSTSDP